MTLLLGKDLSTETGELSGVIISLFFFLLLKPEIVLCLHPPRPVTSGLSPENIAV